MVHPSLGRHSWEKNYAGQKVDELVGTLAETNILIDQTLRGVHDFMQHSAIEVGLEGKPDITGIFDDAKYYYNDNESDLDSVHRNLCKNNKSVCKEELSAWSGMWMLSIVTRVAVAHLFIIIAFLIIFFIFGSIWKFIELVSWVGIKMLSKEDNEIRLKKEADNAGEKGKYTWVAIFKYIALTILTFKFGLGPKWMREKLMLIYFLGILLWGGVHLVIFGANMSALFGEPIVVSEFAPNQAKASRGPGILYFIRLPIISSEVYNFIKSPWIVTPMAAHDNQIICAWGFEPSTGGLAQKRKRVDYDKAQEDGWCVAGGQCQTFTKKTLDFDAYQEKNTPDNLKYSDVGDITAPFTKRCQIVDDYTAEDAAKFAEAAGNKIIDVFKDL